MDSQSRGQASPQPPGCNYFSAQARRGAGPTRPEVGHNPRDYFPNHHHPELHPHPDPFSHYPPRPAMYPHHDIHAAIQRDIEKQRIREEIMSDIVRRRELEAEVMRELIMEQEIGALRTAGTPFGLSPLLGFDSSMRLPNPAVMPLEERIALSIEERERLKGRREGKGSETVPFQRGTSTHVRILEVEPPPVLEGGNEKKIILLAKPDVNTSGLKRKAVTPPVIGVTEPSPPDSMLKKKAKEEWSCALCQISATSEQALNEHLGGKKHKSKEAALKTHSAGKNYKIGLSTKNATESLQISGGVGPITQEVKNKPEVRQKRLKDDNPKKKVYKHWCELCGVGTPSRKTMNFHIKGKKHVKKLSNQEVKVKVGEGSNRKVSETFDGEKSEDHHETMDDALESEDHEPAYETEEELAENGKNATSKYAVEDLDHALKSESHVLENGTETEDDANPEMTVDGTTDLNAEELAKGGKSAIFENVVPENGAGAEDDGTPDMSKPEGPLDKMTQAQDDGTVDVTEPEHDLEDAVVQHKDDQMIIS